MQRRIGHSYGYGNGIAILVWAAVVQGYAFAQPLSEIETQGAGGLTALYPWDRTGENLVVNSSFETSSPEAAEAWTWPSDRTLGLTVDEARGGTKSLLFTDSHTDRRSPAAIQRMELAPGWYVLSGWMKASNAGGNTGGSGGRIEVSTKQTRGALATTPVVSGTADWTRVERRFLFPGGPAEIRLAAYRKPDGKIYFDDIELRAMIPPLVEGFLLYPNYRGILFPGAPQTIRLAVDVRPDLVEGGLDDVRIQTRLVPESGQRPAAESTLSPGEPHVVVELDATDLAPGSYLLELRAVRASSGESLSRYPDHRIVKLTEEQSGSFDTFVDADNRLVLGGAPRFALGIYDTGGYSNASSAYGEDVNKIAEAPFDLYINYWLGRAPTRALSALTTMLQSRNLYYLHTVNRWHEDNERFSQFPPCRNRTPGELGEARYVGCRASELASLPGIAGFYTADERPVGFVEPVFRQYRVLTSSARDGITFIAQNKARELGSWRDAADVFDLHEYPIFNVPEGVSSPLETVYENTRSAVSTLHGSRPVFTVIQYFPHGSKGHWPTYEELRSMSFMAIAGGAKGLLYWSFGAKGLAWEKDPLRKEELWQRLVRVTKEIEGLEPALLRPDAPELLEGVSDPQIKVLCKRLGSEAYFIAVNLSTERSSATFRASERLLSVEVEVEGKRREIALDSESGGTAFTDTFAPHDVHVYRVLLER